MANKLDWRWARCPICNDEYPYMPSWKPATCGKFECVFAYMHPKALEARKKRMREAMPLEKHN